MPELNRMKILNGTLEKKFYNERQRMAEDYDETSARDFWYVYNAAPLAFILSHSRDIFSETYFGLPFYRRIMEEDIVDPRVYGPEREKVEKYIQEAVDKRLPQNQLEPYKRLHELLTNLESSYQGFNSFFQTLVGGSLGGDEFVVAVTEALHCPDGACPEESEIDAVAEAIFTSSSVYASIFIGLLLIRTYPNYAPYMAAFTDRLLAKPVSPEAYGNSRRGLIVILKLMRCSEITRTIIRNTHNEKLMRSWSKIASTPVDELLPIEQGASADVSQISYNPDATGDNIGDLTMFIEAMERDENFSCERYDLYRYRATKLEVDTELFGNYEDLSDADKLVYESMDDLMNTYQAESLMLEWEDDGSPNKVLKTHIMTSKERMEDEIRKRKEKADAISALVKANTEIQKNADNEAAIVEELKNAISEAEMIVPADTKEEAEKNAPKLAELRKIVTTTKKKIAGKGYKNANKLVEELKEAIISSDTTINESWDPAFDEDFLMFLEGSGESDESGDKSDPEAGDEKKGPRNPKTDLVTKVQNKALDYAAKDAEKAALNKEKREKLLNAGKAVAEKPKRKIAGLQEFVQKIDKMDENRRKEFLLKPGYRHKIMKNLRTVIEYGAVAQFKLAWVPFLALIKHASRIKDARIRNELSRELGAEIRICEEKISDANAQGDNKSKYELMRIKDKLEAERQRVRINSKYI